MYAYDDDGVFNPDNIASGMLTAALPGSKVDPLSARLASREPVLSDDA